MNKQQLNGGELCHKLILEEFRYWNYRRVNISEDSIEAIKKNVDELRFEITRSLSERLN
ncbi:MAG: hypothetical protein JWR18_429 [Segetibacter sp.]|jgi:hypothetical protein|nr:hypothetical protein [Segetibacter sp.]